MKRPFVPVVACYVSGLLLAKVFQPSLEMLFAVSLVIFLVAFAVAKARAVLIWPLLMLVGWTNLIFHSTTISPDDLRKLVGDKTEIATVRGVLMETPHVKMVERHGDDVEHSVAKVRVSGFRGEGDWQPAAGEIIVTTPSVLPENYFAGQPVEISGVIARPPLPLAEGLFDDRDYLETRGFFYQLGTTSTNDWALREPVSGGAPLTDRFLGWSKRTLAIGLPGEDEPLRLLWAMTLGWRTAFTGDIADPFLRAGTMHMFAIDGLRIALISGMLVALLRVLQLSRGWCGAIAIPAIWFYTAATGWESSAVRASVMMTVVLGGWSLKRPSDLLNSLAAAAFLILLWEPRQLFEASFQLSFFVMLTIGLLLPKLDQVSDQWLRHDPLLPEDLLPKWRRVTIPILRAASRYFSLSFAAWIGSIPLSAKYFHLFSPVSTFANMVAVPLGTFALMSDLGALICGTWFPWATGLFNNAAWFFMSAMTDASEWFTGIPGSYFYVPEPSWILVAGYYGVLLVILSGWLNSGRRRIFAGSMAVVIVAIYFCRWERSRSEVDLTVLPLSGGQAVYVDADGRADDWLINCGDDKAVELTLKSFLRAQGVNRVPRLALTEGNARDCGGATTLDGLFGIDELWTSPVHFRSSVYNEMVSRFESARHKVFTAGERAGYWQVLWPAEANRFSRADDNALVLRGSFGGAKVLLLSGLSRAGQSALLSTTNDVRADIVVAGLPDEGEPLSDALLAAVQPKVVVIVDSEYPATRHAGQKLKDRLAQAKIPVIYTREAGAVKITADKNGWSLATMDGQTFTGRQNLPN